MRNITVTAIVLGVLALATPAQAAPPSYGARATAPGSMNNEFSIFAISSPFEPYAGAGAGIGLGARYQLTLVPEGILGSPRVRDDIGLEFGADWAHYSWNDTYPGYGTVGWSYNEIAPVVGAVWNFWLTPRLALYPKADLFYRIGWWSSNVPGASTPGGFGGFDAQLAAGLVYKLDKVALRAEIGSYSIRFGIGF